MSDAGDYECHGQNYHNTTHHHIHLVVEGRYNFILLISLYLFQLRCLFIFFKQYFCSFLHCVLSLAAQCIVIGPVGDGWVGGRCLLPR